MTPIQTHTLQRSGYTARISVFHDEYMGEPWKEHDGHGIVSEWTRRDKTPGELVLNSDLHSKRFYDYQGTLEIARRDGWGLDDEDKAKLAAKLKREPTKGEIVAEAVRRDFEHLRAWCNDEWHWLGYDTKIKATSGEIIDGDSCCGFDDKAYMLECATEAAWAEIDRHIALTHETALAECCP